MRITVYDLLGWLLQSRSQLTPATAQAMKKMVGFRNIAVHSDQELQRPIPEAILVGHLSGFEAFLVELATQQK